ncbi:hypothetical protein BKK81_02350 [Cupriavidus sp. USMAHM13]|uniref:YcxB family protein n=1 Tax=Cupriavidus sp. USMAHM13 TaxID=1389192 RepID=UPI0008A6AC4A|nr:YcxB family protein [Cupriavidus sp. USMAHM13]AOY98262.1 hypothetical protein BKK81_02350 [Cupriavidus sp. USMAHM13]
MPEPAELHYRVSEDDFVAVRRVLAWPQAWVRLLALVIYPIAGAVFAGVAWSRGELVWMAGALAYAVSPWVLRYAVATPLSRRCYRRSPTLGMAATMRVDDDGVALASACGRMRLQWADIVRWYQDERLLLLFIQPSYCFVIPKRADADGHVLPRLCGLLRQHLGRAPGCRTGAAALELGKARCHAKRLPL